MTAEQHTSLTPVLFVVSLVATADPGTADGTKILFIVANINSHVLYFSRLAADLAELGHVTHVVAPSNARKPDFISEGLTGGKFTYTAYKVDGEESFMSSRYTSEVLVRLSLSTSVWEQLPLMTEFWQGIVDHCEADCVHLLEDHNLMIQIRNGDYQFAVMDPFAAHCYYAVPYALGIPYATFSISFYGWIYRIPRLPSFVSSLGYSDRMTFWERLTTFVIEAGMTVLMNANKTTTFVERLAPDRPALDVTQLFQKSSLWFFLEDLAVGYALPLMPNTVAVGDLMAGRPGKPLPVGLEKFISASIDGVMVVSFGSFFDFVPSDVVSKFCDAFRDRRNRLHVVWKMKNTQACPDDGRVNLVPWIPQNDLLADPRVKLFICHGGFNSVVEAAYHAKPLIIFPISIDQPTNAKAAELKGFAIRMDIGNFSSDTLLTNLNQLLVDPTYKRNARLASAILRDRCHTPAQRASAMIDHVIKYGDGHLRTGAFELNTVQFIMVDIFAALASVAIIVLSSVFAACFCIRRKCGRKRNTAKPD